MMPFGGNEQLAWSPDSRQIAYTCRKKTGRDYATSTDSDIFLYDIAKKTTRNLCKPEGWTAPSETDYTRSLQNQQVNAKNGQDANVGYDQNPLFSPDGKYIAWSSMERDGYESDRARLCVYELRTGKKTVECDQGRLKLRCEQTINADGRLFQVNLQVLDPSREAPPLARLDTQVMAE